MRTYYITSLAILTLVFLVSSCTEIIDIDINASDPEMVVEATIGMDETANVVLTRTIGLDDTNDFSNVENAVVTISDNEGNSEILTEEMPGVYKSKTMLGQVGRTYNLKVESDAKIISSICKIPDYVAIDSLSVVNSIYPGGGGPMGNMQSADFYEINVTYTDPVNELNYYRLILFLNGVPQSGNHVYDDRFINGNQVTNTLIMYNPEVKAGDKIMGEMECFDKSVFEYFKSMGNSAMGPRNSSSPANPYTNLTGTLLGFFSAHTVERKEYIVP